MIAMTSLADLFLGVDRLGADVRRQDDIRQVGQRRSLALALGHVDVECGAAEPAAGLQRVEERRLVDDAAAGDVHEEGAGLDLCQLSSRRSSRGSCH